MEFRIPFLFFASIDLALATSARKGTAGSDPLGSSVGTSSNVSPPLESPGTAGNPAVAGPSTVTPAAALSLSTSPQRSTPGSPRRSPPANPPGVDISVLDASILEDIRAAIKRRIRPDQSVFWTAEAMKEAIAFARRFGKLTVWDTKKGQASYWWSYMTEVDITWSEMFAKLSSGTVWVLFKDLTPIGTTGDHADSVWNRDELPNLITTVDGRPPVDEIIQVGADDMNQRVQIWPVDIRHYPSADCAWFGNAPRCKGSCPSSTRQVARSYYGTSMNRCLRGHKVYCCRTAGTDSTLARPQSGTVKRPRLQNP